jgi:hypothetical protein
MSGTSVVTALGIVGVAYTNNDLAADTATSLFDLDVAGNRVALQSPPNGVPGAVAANVVPTGNLGIDGEAPAGFDIYTRLEASRSTIWAASFRERHARVLLNELLTGAAIFIGCSGTTSSTSRCSISDRRDLHLS